MGAEYYQDDPGLVQTAVDFESRVAKKPAARKCHFETFPIPAGQYSMASWRGEYLRVQLAQAMSGVTYPDT